MASGTDGLEAAARRALYRRMIAQLRSAVRGASEEQLLRAIAARSASGSIAEILAAVPAEAGQTTEDWAASATSFALSVCVPTALPGSSSK